MSFRVDEIITYQTSVVCDGCGSERVLADEKLGFDQRMNGALSKRYTFENSDGVFKNYCPKCSSKEASHG